MKYLIRKPELITWVCLLLTPLFGWAGLVTENPISSAHQITIKECLLDNCQTSLNSYQELQEKTARQQKTEEEKKEKENEEQKSTTKETKQEEEQVTEKTSTKPTETERKKNFIDWINPWKKTLELSYVVTGGNTLSSSFSFGSTLTRSPNEKDTYTLKTFLLRSHSTRVVRKAIGTETSFTVEEEKTRQLSAENYLLSGQYDRRVTGRLITNLAFVWDRNKFSGVSGRALWTAGAGLVLADSARTKMRTQAGVSFTVRKYSQQPVSAFLGFRYSFNWEQKLFDNASFSTSFIFDDNLARISDWRYDWSLHLAAPLSKNLALKTGVRILRNHKPPMMTIPLFSPEGYETGIQVSIPRGKVDNFFTTTIVFNF